MDINTSRMSIQSKIVKSNLGKLRIPDLHEMVRFTYMKFHISYTFLAPGKISEKKNYDVQVSVSFPGYAIINKKSNRAGFSENSDGYEL